MKLKRYKALYLYMRQNIGWQGHAGDCDESLSEKQG